MAPFGGETLGRLEVASKASVLATDSPLNGVTRARFGASDITMPVHTWIRIESGLVRTSLVRSYVAGFTIRSWISFVSASTALV
jgi:hypothetical protein